MIRTLPRTLLVVLVTAASLPATAPAQPAQPAATPPPGDPPPETLTTQDHEALDAAERLADELSKVLEKWITTSATPEEHAIPEEQMFARLYYPIPEPEPKPRTHPRKYTTPYSELADRKLVTLVDLENQTLASSHTFLYAFLTDSNGYLVAQTNPPATPPNRNAAQFYLSDRTRQLLGDTPSVLAGHSELRYLRQRIKLATDDTIYDLSVPVNVNKKHWGCVRIGYRRSE